MQSRTSSKTASLLVRDAMRHLLITFPIIFSEVVICALGLSAVLMFEDAAEDVDRIGAEGEFVVREESPNRNLVIRCLGGILILFIDFKSV